jgi:hypothetical protein
MQNEINTYPIQQFIELVKHAEISQKKVIMLEIKVARNLALTLGEVTAKLYQDYDNLIKTMQNSNYNDIVEIRMDGGGFK